MLVFIEYNPLSYLIKSSFNTSHVGIYRFLTDKKGRTFSSFNTSHVGIYQNLPFSADARTLFQYIPCWYLSNTIHPCMLFLCSFNTSHVGIYQNNSRRLQKPLFVSIHPMLVFIHYSQLFRAVKSCFNTSHVGIYHIQCTCYE